MAETAIKKESLVTYQETKIGRSLYRVTSVHKGEFELAKALEKLIVGKILREENSLQTN